MKAILDSLIESCQFSSLTVVSDTFWRHESQHARPPCPSPTPGVYSNLCPLSCWCHPTISSCAIPFSSCLQSFLASGSFLICCPSCHSFLLRSKHFLISWMQSPSAVILEPKKMKCHCFPIYLPWSDRTRCHDLCLLNVEFSASFFTLLFHFHQEAL